MRGDDYAVSCGAHAARPKIERIRGVALWGGLSALDFLLPSLHGAAPHAGIGRAVGAFAVLPE